VPPKILGKEFYDRKSVIVANDLIGTKLVRLLPNGTRLEGAIVETEAYGGSRDPASHAFRGKTNRNEVMFGPPGRAYVYFTYGFHYCLNIVTNPGRVGAGAVLIRAAEPLLGLEFMTEMRGTRVLTELASGPGKLCQAFAIDKVLNGTDLTRNDSTIFLIAKSSTVNVRRSTRVGITWAKSRRWRFFLENSPFVSRKSN